MTQVSECLRECESFLVRGAKNKKQHPRDRVGVALGRADRGQRRIESCGVMREQLVEAAGEVIEWIAMCREHTLHWKIAKARERAKEIAQRVVTRRRIESDVRRDSWEHVVAREEHAVAAVDEDGVVVSVARRPAQLRRATAEVNAVAVV